MQSKPAFPVRLIAVSGAMLVTACTHSPMSDDVVARASLISAQNQGMGTATIVDVSGTMMLKLEARGVPVGTHGIHIHQVGKCDAPSFESAGPHWNPTGRKHGLSNSAGPHAGDFPNIKATSAGVATASIALTGGASSLLDADGAAIIIHAQPDDNMTDPSGNSGARIVCGVLERVR